MRPQPFKLIHAVTHSVDRCEKRSPHSIPLAAEREQWRLIPFQFAGHPATSGLFSCCGRSQDGVFTAERREGGHVKE